MIGEDREDTISYKQGIPQGPDGHVKGGNKEIGIKSLTTDTTDELRPSIRQERNMFAQATCIARRVDWLYCAFFLRIFLIYMCWLSASFYGFDSWGYHTQPLANGVCFAIVGAFGILFLCFYEIESERTYD